MLVHCSLDAHLLSILPLPTLLPVIIVLQGHALIVKAAWVLCMCCVLFVVCCVYPACLCVKVCCVTSKVHSTLEVYRHGSVVSGSAGVWDMVSRAEYGVKIVPPD